MQRPPRKATNSNTIIGVAALIGIIVWGASHSNPNRASSSSSSSETYATSNPGLDAKAVASTSKAEKLAGGFTDEQRGEYQRGIQHILNNHRVPGEFTISSVIWDENNREQARAQQRQALASEQQRQKSAASTEGEKADMDGVLRLGSQSTQFADMVRGYTFDGNRITFTVDADYWNPMSDQDKTMFKQTMYEAWALTYKRHVGDDQHPILNIDDLNGTQVDSYY